MAIVDDADFDEINGHKWYAQKGYGGTWYACRSSGPAASRVSILMHRQIMCATQGMDVDHINRNGLDNRRMNLRLCTRSQNIGNAKIGGRNKTGFKGVYWNKEKGVFHAQIKVNCKTRHVGFFKTAIEASMAYQREALKAFW